MLKVSSQFLIGYFVIEKLICHSEERSCGLFLLFVLTQIGNKTLPFSFLRLYSLHHFFPLSWDEFLVFNLKTSKNHLVQSSKFWDVIFHFRQGFYSYLSGDSLRFSGKATGIATQGRCSPICVHSLAVLELF